MSLHGCTSVPCPVCNPTALNSDEFGWMSGLIPTERKFYDENMDCLATEMIVGLGGMPVQAWWPGWLRLRTITRPWIVPISADPNPFPHFELRRKQ